MSHAAILVAVDGPEEKFEEQIAHEMEPFDEGGKFFSDGSRWDWWVIGGRFSGRLFDRDFVRRDALTLEAYSAWRRTDLEKSYQEAQAELAKREHPDEMAELIFGTTKSETLEQFLAKYGGFTFPAFLADRHWHEASRMGWFGFETATECEVKVDWNGETIPTEQKLKCKSKAANGEDAYVVTWNEPKAKWGADYYHRFIERLDPKKYLVVVDYHV